MESLVWFVNTKTTLILALLHLPMTQRRMRHCDPWPVVDLVNLDTGHSSTWDEHEHRVITNQWSNRNIAISPTTWHGMVILICCSQESFLWLLINMENYTKRLMSRVNFLWSLYRNCNCYVCGGIQN